MQAISRTSRVISTNHKIKLPIWAQKLVLALALALALELALALARQPTRQGKYQWQNTAAPLHPRKLLKIVEVFCSRQPPLCVRRQRGSMNHESRLTAGPSP